MMRTTLPTLAVAVILAGTINAAPPQVQCGSTLGPGGEYRLTSDLSCVFDGVTLLDGAVLNLAQHTVNGGLYAVRLMGHGGVVRNGTIVGSEGIRLQGSVHTVRNVNVLTSGAGILDASQGSQVLNNYFEAPTGAAITMSEPIALGLGAGATISDNYIVCSDLCVRIYGQMARILDNTILCGSASCTGSGITVQDFDSSAAISNVIARNKIVGFSVGIDVHSTQNLIERNDVRADVIGLLDRNGDCLGNTWRLNLFQKSDPICIK